MLAELISVIYIGLEKSRGAKELGFLGKQVLLSSSIIWKPRGCKKDYKNLTPAQVAVQEKERKQLRWSQSPKFVLAQTENIHPKYNCNLDFYHNLQANRLQG